MGKDSMDIDERLNELIFQYRIDRYNPAYHNYVMAQTIIKNVYNRIEKSYGRIILVSENQTDIGYFSDFAGKKCGYIIIENPVLPNMDGFSVYGGSECFLVISLNYRDELTARISERFEKVFDLYDFFEDEGLYFNHNYYEIYPQGYHSFELNQKTDDYTEFNMGVIFLNHRNRFEMAQDSSRKEKYLGEMIFDCVYNRDFLMLKECIQEYQRHEYNDSENYILFGEKVESLLLEIKNRLLRRDKEDVVMYWLDALEYGDDREMPFLNSLDESALCMDNMYTVTPSTHPTFRVLFAKRRVIEEQSYTLKVVTKQDCRLIQELEKRGYYFVCYGHWVKNEEEFRANRYVFKNADFSYVFWTYLKDVMLEPGKKYFAVIHELFNTHYPYFSFGYTDKFFTPACYIPGMPKEDHQKSMKRQHDEALKYVDRYLKFYADMLPEDSLKIYMSDHGHSYYGRYHVVMKLQQYGIAPKRCDSMLSFFDFDRFILEIIDRKEVAEELLNQESVMIQDSEYRHYQYILDSIEKLQITERSLLGYQGVITKEDMLICHREGITYYPEKYYKRFVNNGEIVTCARMEYLKELMSNKYVDLDSSDEFKYSRVAVNGMKKHYLRIKDTEERKWKIISRVVGEAVDTGVTAIRGGGFHTERLLMFLDENIRKRIRYVIDYNKECEAANLGAQIIAPDEINKYAIDCIIISSFKYRESWKKEFDNQRGIRVFDFYAEMEAEGIFCDREFYRTIYEKEDFL